MSPNRFAPCLVAVLSACGYAERSAILPGRLDMMPPIAGFEDVRAVDGFPNEQQQASFDRSWAAFAKTTPLASGKRRLDTLVLGAGGPNGAFGAGVLTAWTKRGDRPDFWFVTGVSVGALLAPFAFAGPEYDHRIEAMFKSISPNDLHTAKASLPAVLWDESMLDNSPLRRVIERGFDRELMRAVAARHAEGRRCAVGTTNLDTGRFVIWDLGAIASRDSETALQLCRDVLLASAAIPVLYPPVRFSQGEQDEMHVDGSVVRPFFLPQNVVNDFVSIDRAGIDLDQLESRIFVLSNSPLQPRATTVPRDTLAIATRTVTMMMRTMTAEHILHLNLLAQAWGSEFLYLSIPEGVELAVESFTARDTEQLFALGGQMLNAHGWHRELPISVRRAELRRIEAVRPGHGR